MTPFAQPILGPREKELVNEVLASGRLTENRMCERFTTKLVERTRRHVCLTSNGSTALHAALVALGVGPGDQVVLPACTYIATLNAVQLTGATPVVVDVDPSDWTMLSPRQYFNSATKVVMPVSLYGVDRSHEIAGEVEGHFVATGQRIYTIADRAEDAPCESECDIDCYSFHGSKVVTTGEGGAVACRDPLLHDRVWSVVHQATDGPGRYTHKGLGFNYRLNELAAAIGVAQMERLDEFVAKRKEIFAAYDAFLPDWCIRQSSEHQSGYWAFAIQIPQPRLYAAVKSALKAADIEFRPVFPPVCDAPHFSGICQSAFTARDLARWGLVLPTHCVLTEQSVEFICDTIRSAE